MFAGWVLSIHQLLWNLARAHQSQFEAGIISRSVDSTYFKLLVVFAHDYDCGLFTLHTEVEGRGNYEHAECLSGGKYLYLHLPTRTYLLTPLSRVLLEKLTSLQIVEKFHAFYGTRSFITAFTSALHLSLSWAPAITYKYICKTLILFENSFTRFCFIVWMGNLMLKQKV
jgi:hypothetical protein